MSTATTRAKQQIGQIMRSLEVKPQEGLSGKITRPIHITFLRRFRVLPDALP